MKRTARLLRRGKRDKKMTKKAIIEVVLVDESSQKTNIEIKKEIQENLRSL